MGLSAEQGSGFSRSGSHSPAETAWSVGTAWTRSQRGRPGELLHPRCYKPWFSGWAVGPGSENWSLGFYQRRHARRKQDPCTWLQQKWGLVVPPGGLHWRWQGRTVLLLYSDNFLLGNNSGLHSAFCISYQRLRYAKSLQTDLALLFHAPLQQTPRACIAPVAMESNYHTQLQHVSVLRIFHWDYFSRLHSDFQYDMLSFRARCFPYSVDLVLLTNTPSLNAKWESLTNLSNLPNDSIPEKKDRTNL